MTGAVFYLRHETARLRAIEAIRRAPDGWRVTLDEPARNGEINAALHARLTEVAKRVKWAGQKLDVTTWKRLFVAAWLRQAGEPVQLLPALDWHGVDVIFERTSTMSQAKVRDLLTYIDSWVAEFHPEVDEQKDHQHAAR